MAAGLSMDSLLADLCSQVEKVKIKLIDKDFAEHFQWLDEIVDETCKQLWGGDEENQPEVDAEPVTETGPYLLPRTPSMKRRRKETDQGRLAALNASLLETSTTTRSRRAASRVATVKMALARQKQNQPARKLRRPRSSCVRAEQRLMDEVRRGRLPGGADESAQWASTDDNSEEEAVVEKPAVRTMVRAYEALVGGSDDASTPAGAYSCGGRVRKDGEDTKMTSVEIVEKTPPNRRQTRTRAAETTQDQGDAELKGQGEKTPPRNQRQTRTRAVESAQDEEDSKMTSVEIVEKTPPNRRQTRTRAVETTQDQGDAELKGPDEKTPPRNQRQTRTRAAESAEDEEDAKMTSVEIVEKTPPNRRQTRTRAAETTQDQGDAELKEPYEKTPPRHQRQTRTRAAGERAG
ncbi:serine/arginine repetitive matrix protein 2-like [Pollicipes pollicipes]|uniref:serine/arginine repetitive matrix protein 2-like n=1 Tax=Pollicipes pollicipes TaxID=41117 RepID=UPI001885315E|nr:serine/arginine repetitive matrix protein 2-like [Pollicipes pollicipes]